MMNLHASRPKRSLVMKWSELKRASEAFDWSVLERTSCAA